MNVDKYFRGEKIDINNKPLVFNFAGLSVFDFHIGDINEYARSNAYWNAQIMNEYSRYYSFFEKNSVLKADFGDMGGLIESKAEITALLIISVFRKYYNIDFLKIEYCEENVSNYIVTDNGKTVIYNSSIEVYKAYEVILTQCFNNAFA